MQSIYKDKVNLPVEQWSWGERARWLLAGLCLCRLVVSCNLVSGSDLPGKRNSISPGILKPQSQRLEPSSRWASASSSPPQKCTQTQGNPAVQLIWISILTAGDGCPFIEVKSLAKNWVNVLGEMGRFLKLCALVAVQFRRPLFYGPPPLSFCCHKKYK